MACTAARAPGAAACVNPPAWRRPWALVVAAAIYVPANLPAVVTRLAARQPGGHDRMSGAHLPVAVEPWPLAVLVFLRQRGGAAALKIWPDLAASAQRRSPPHRAWCSARGSTSWSDLSAAGRCSTSTSSPARLVALPRPGDGPGRPGGGLWWPSGHRGADDVRRAGFDPARLIWDRRYHCASERTSDHLNPASRLPAAIRRYAAAASASRWVWIISAGGGAC